jgi:hypothetical protein
VGTTPVRFSRTIWVVGMIAGLLALLAIQYQVCLYWRLEIRRVPSVALDDERHIRFDGRRVVDWTTGSTWLDSSNPSESSFIIQHSDSLRVEVRRSRQRLLNDRGNYSVVYRDIASNHIKERYEFQVDRPLKRVGERGLVSNAEEIGIPGWIERVEFGSDGPIVRRVNLPATTSGESFAQLFWLDEFHVARGASHANTSRGLSQILTQQNMGPTGNVPMQWQIFRIDGDDATSIANWQTEWCDYETAYVEGDRIITRSLDRTCLEIRNIRGEVVKSIPLPWDKDGGPLNSTLSSIGLDTRGFLIRRSQLPGSSNFGLPSFRETYYDLLTLAPLSVPPMMKIQYYDRPSGGIVARSDKELSITWRDGDRPPFHLPLSFPAEAVAAGKTLVIADTADPMRFQVFDLHTREFKQFDWRNRRTFACIALFGAWAIWCCVWLIHSYRHQWPIWLDLIVVGGVVMLLYLFSAWLLCVSHSSTPALLAIPVLWCIASSMWLIFGYESWPQRIAVHLATICVSQLAIIEFDMPIATRLESVFIGVITPIALLLAKGLTQFFQANSARQSSRLQIIDLLWLTVSISAVLLLYRLLAKRYNVWRIAEELTYIPWQYVGVVYGSMLGAILLLYLVTLGPRQHWVAVIGGTVAAAAFFTGTEMAIRFFMGVWPDRLHTIMLLLWSCIFVAVWFCMMLFRSRGWRYRWRWASVKQERSQC